jgi:hypothetical protein
VTFAFLLPFAPPAAGEELDADLRGAELAAESMGAR